MITLLDLEKEFATIAMMVVFLNSFVFLLGRVNLDPKLQIIIVSLIASVPMAIFGIIPFAIIGDIAEKDGEKTGNYKIGTFYAVRGLFMIQYKDSYIKS